MQYVHRYRLIYVLTVIKLLFLPNTNESVVDHHSDPGTRSYLDIFWYRYQRKKHKWLSDLSFFHTYFTATFSRSKALLPLST